MSRRGFISPEGPRILYMCSCNVARRRMIDNLPVGASVDTGSAHFVINQQPCHGLQAAMLIIIPLAFMPTGI